MTHAHAHAHTDTNTQKIFLFLQSSHTEDDGVREDNTVNTATVHIYPSEKCTNLY